MTEHLATPKELRQLADEIEVKIHLASMDARDRWESLKKRLTALEHRIATSAEPIVKGDLVAIEEALRKLKSDVFDGL